MSYFSGISRHLSGVFSMCRKFFIFLMKVNIFLSYATKKFQISKNFRRVSENFSLYTMIILFFYHMTQHFSGLIKNFRIAMLPCYRVFSLTGREIQCLPYARFFLVKHKSQNERAQALVRFASIQCNF